jgi:hypothetical protein
MDLRSGQAYWLLKKWIACDYLRLDGNEACEWLHDCLGVQAGRGWSESTAERALNGDSVFLYTDRGELIRAQLTARGYNEISRVALLAPTFPFAGRKVAWPPPAYANGYVLFAARAGGAGLKDSPFP